MDALPRRLFALVTLVLTVALTACTGGGQSAASPTSEPVVEAPTRTPRPTREPTEEPRPTAEPTAVVLGRPTAETAAGEIAAVQFDDLETYEHPSGVFSIEIPRNWELQDNSKTDELILVWTDPTRNGGVIVDIFEDETAYTDEQLTDILQTFLENSFGSEPDFRVQDPETQTDGSILLAWGYTAQADNDIAVDLLGNSFIEQRESKVSILTTLVPSDQFDTTVKYTGEIINTYRIDPSAALSSADTSDSSDASTASTASGDVPATIVAVGDTVEVGPDLTMTITGIEEPKGDDFFKPDAGNKFLIVQAIFENSGSDDQAISTLLQMSLLDSTGAKYDIDLLAATLAEQTPDGDVPAGGTLEGGVGFQIPADASGLVFIFDPMIDGEPVGVTLD